MIGWDLVASGDCHIPLAMEAVVSLPDMGICGDYVPWKVANTLAFCPRYYGTVARD